MAVRSRVAAGSTTPTAPGPSAKTTRARGGRLILGDEVYLWALVAIELAVTAHLRARFRSAHGG